MPKHITPCESCGEVRRWSYGHPQAVDGKRICGACGGRGRHHKIPVSDDEILEHIRRLAAVLDRTPGKTAWDRYAARSGYLPRSSSIRDRFGGVAEVRWTDVCRFAGLSPNTTGAPSLEKRKVNIGRNRQMVTGHGLDDRLPGTVKHFAA
jgi:hypothetical protein